MKHAWTRSLNEKTVVIGLTFVDGHESVTDNDNRVIELTGCFEKWFYAPTERERRPIGETAESFDRFDTRGRTVSLFTAEASVEDARKTV